jgi:DNA invertase Pin-like site-specific DNA recombinase
LSGKFLFKAGGVQYSLPAGASIWLREGTRKTLAYLTRLDAWGVAWRSYSEPFFDSCGIMRDVVISIMATLAEQERISISERTKAGLARAKRAGKVLGRAPYTVDMVAVRAKQKAGQSLRGIARTSESVLLCL